VPPTDTIVLREVYQRAKKAAAVPRTPLAAASPGRTAEARADGSRRVRTAMYPSVAIATSAR